MEKISIIVPVYNTAKTLKRCIESILNQTYENIEIVLVDDGSSDDSGLICDEYQDRSNVKIVHKLNGGVSSARNAGLSIATGEYIGFVDSDDYVDKQMFQLMSQEMNDVDLVMCGYLQNNEIYPGTSVKQIVDKIDAVSNVIGDGGFRGYLWNKLFEKDIIARCNLQFPQDIHMCEDLLFCVQYIDKISKARLLPEPLYYYENSEESITNRSFSKKKYSVIKAYNALMNIDVITMNKSIYEKAGQKKIMHCLSLWYSLIRASENNKKKYLREIKKEIKSTSTDFLWAKGYSMKQKFLYFILKVG